MSDYDWYVEQDLSEHSGEWVAIKEKQIVASDSDFNAIIQALHSLGLKLPDVFLARIPEDKALVYRC
ncbi:MAG: hypothetical protein ACE5FT_05165 [Candidatus Nanoarchaeia archaeon]